MSEPAKTITTQSGIDRDANDDFVAWCDCGWFNTFETAFAARRTLASHLDASHVLGGKDSTSQRVASGEIAATGDPLRHHPTQPTRSTT